MAFDGGLVGVLLAMLIGSLAAGALPYLVRVRESQLNVVSALGGGLLVGTALSVIVPEGFHMFAQANAYALTSQGSSHGARPHDDHGHGHGHGHGHASLQHQEGGTPEGLAGLALVAGFVAMLLLDRLQHAAGGGHGCGHAHHDHGAATRQAGRGDEGRGTQREQAKGQPVASAAAEAAGAPTPGGGGPPPPGLPPGSGPERAIAGLMVHCAADGLALGAASLSGDARLGAIVGLAMVLHKAPMAFGLSAYLLSWHWPWARAQRTLLLFSGAAPAATLATVGLLRALPAFTSAAAVALCVLFSGGTFLYAATLHILPEVLGPGGAAGAPASAVWALAAGAVAPCFLNWGHHH